MLSKFGRDIEKGTVVYLFQPIPCLSGLYHFIVSTFKIGERGITVFNTNTYCHTYIFDPHDELWATKGIRELWRKKPFLHPHYTLFQAIYSKLE